jgi:tetratricopeptide (TPR) repeat protein
MPASNQTCMVCGEPLTSTGRCANCEATASLRRHRFGLPVLVLIIIAGFSFTRMVVDWFNHRQDELASDWYQRGVAALNSHRPAQAVEDFETALVYAKQDDDEYRVRLAESLLAAGRPNEARSRLLSLLEEHPTDAKVNLELARIEAGKGELKDANRYYHAAIDGIWSPGKTPAVERLNTRFELLEVLAANHQNEAAETELAALLPELPRSANAHSRLGQIYFQLGDAHRALAEFQHARQLDHNFAAAYAGTGAVALQAGDYPAAKRYLTDAVSLDDRDANSRTLLTRAEQLLAADPFSPGVNATERARRTVAAYEAAVKRLDECVLSRAKAAAGSPPHTSSSEAQADADKLVQLQGWAEQLRRYATEGRLRGRDDVVENMMRFVFATEDAAARMCGAPSGMDELLATIGHHRWGSQ